jgi:hypothetical protein
MTKARDLADFIASGTIAQTVTADGVDVGDNELIRLGDSQDLRLFHNGSASYISDQGDGNLVLQASEALIVQNGAGTENLLTAYQNGAVSLYHDNSVKIATTSTGVDVTGNVSATGGIYADTLMQIDNTTGFGKVEIGGSTGAFIDLKTPASDDYDGRIYYDGSQLYITAANNQPTQLRHDNNTKLATTSTGVQVTGTVAATSFTGDGSGLTGVGFTTNVITTNTTATKDNHYYLNAASITLTLPASPSVGDEVRFSEVAGNTNCIIGRNGSNIMGDASDLTVDTAYLVLYLRYVDATIGWAFS